MQNLELKAYYPVDRALERVKMLDILQSYDLLQEDTYFSVDGCRLKLRSINNKEHELIWYSRPDTLEAKASCYEIYQSAEPEQLKKVLSAALGVSVVVKKLRKAFIYKNCRIHIDSVEDLGEFIEFEVMMIPGRTAEQASNLMEELKNHFQIKHKDLIEASYSNLLLVKEVRV